MKHVRADKKKRDRNLRRKSALRTTLRQTEAAIADGEMEQAQELYREAASQLDRAAGKGIIKRVRQIGRNPAYHTTLIR